MEFVLCLYGCLRKVTSCCIPVPRSGTRSSFCSRVGETVLSGEGEDIPESYSFISRHSQPVREPPRVSTDTRPSTSLL